MTISFEDTNIDIINSSNITNRTSVSEENLNKCINNFESIIKNSINSIVLQQEQKKEKKKEEEEKKQQCRSSFF